MSAQQRSALFIDGANLYAATKALGFDIDYRRLLREFQSRDSLLRAFYYTAIVEDQEYSRVPDNRHSGDTATRFRGETPERSARPSPALESRYGIRQNDEVVEP
jgi:uncharacterized LabA/DUF88 family protein